MKLDPVQTLRAMLFGQEPYSRPGKPDFEILADLAPVLGDDLTVKALSELAYMEAIPPYIRHRILTALLAHVPPDLVRRNLLGEIILSSAFDSFAPHIPEELLEPSIEAIRDYEEYIGYRSTAILALADRLPGEQGQRLLLEEALTAARAPEWDHTRERALLDYVGVLAPPLPQEAAAELLEAVRGISHPDDQVRGLAILAPLLPEEQHQDIMPQLLESIHNLADPHLQAEAWFELGKRSPGSAGEEYLRQAFQAAQDIDLEKSGRMQLLLSISLYAPPPIESQAWQEARRPHDQGVFLWPPAEEAMLAELADLARHPPSFPEGRLRSQVQSLELPDLPNNFYSLIPFLSEDQLAKALWDIPRVDWEPGVPDALYVLAPYLPEDLISEALDLVAGWEAEEVRVQGLKALAPHLPKDLLSKALEITADLESKWWRGRAAQALREAAGLSPEEHPVLQTPAPGEDLRRLWKPLPGELKTDLLFEWMGTKWKYYGGAGAPSGTLESEEQFGFDEEISGEYDEPEEARVADWLEEAEEETGAEPIESESLDDLDYSLEPQPEYEELQAEGTAAAPEDDTGMTFVEDTSKQPVVNTGFTPREHPDDEIPRTQPLVQNQEYYFWLHIGRQKDTAIAKESPILEVDKLPPEAHLKVVLFAFEGEIEIVPGADIGEVKILTNRKVEVSQPVVKPDNLKDKEKVNDHLYFPVKTPDRSGDFRLRCNLYCQGVLVQSHLIQARVTTGKAASRLEEFDLSKGPPLRHSLDYTLSNTLQSESISQLEPHSLSILLNDNGNGTHGFRFYGAENGKDIKGDASFTGLELQNMIEQARGALRKAAWDSKEEWQPPAAYRYAEKPADAWVDRLRSDLVTFAKWGARFYRRTLQGIAESHSSNPQEIDQRKADLEALLRRPGFVQIAARETSRHVLPAAMIYDYPIHDALPGDMYKLCPEFQRALEAGDPLLDTSCFQGQCPSRKDDPSLEDLTMVCPSGFWGYRHIIGMPVSIGDQVAETEMKIAYTDNPQILAAVSMDEDFKLRDGHMDKLRHLRDGIGWVYGDEGLEILEFLRREASHLVYFYCHGGLTPDGVPYLQVGPDEDQWGIITPTLLPNMHIKWEKPKPLVFINGCHTTALEPAKALDLVTSFVKEAHAVGVIGTEITIFEPLAIAFAEECLAHFLNGTSIGEAIRLARLKLLQDGNPLGLVYIPFVVSSLSLVQE